MLDGARLIALQAGVHWLCYGIFVLQQATSQHPERDT